MTNSSEQFNANNQEVQPEEKSISGNRPDGVGPLPEWSLWQPKIEQGKDGQQRESSVKSPDGKTYEIGEGEQFIVEKGKNGDYEAAIVDANGKKTILRESLVSREAETQKQDQEEKDRLRESLGLEKKVPYDRERLNKITNACSRGTHFGLEVNLDDEDKRQIEIVNGLVEEQITEAMKDDEEWKKFEKLEGEILSKGAMLMHNSYVDGGENAHTHQVDGDRSKGESPVQIVVPSRVYNAHHYMTIVRDTRKLYLKPSARDIRGQSASFLGENLNQLKYFIKQTEGKK